MMNSWVLYFDLLDHEAIKGAFQDLEMMVVVF
jgi:hypothetical protein